MAQAVYAGVIIWGVYLIAEGETTTGGLIACSILVGRAMSPLGAVAAMLTRLQQSRMASKIWAQGEVEGEGAAGGGAAGEDSGTSSAGSLRKTNCVGPVATADAPASGRQSESSASSARGG